MSTYYLAIDMGASSGRHILASVEDGHIQLEEIYRFETGMNKKGDTLVWDHEKLWNHILAGIAKCKELNKIPKSVGIDTWGVDFVLLDKDETLIGDAVGYRDSRTKGMDAVVFDKIPEVDLYKRTGIQKQPFNTIYQLTAIKEKHPEMLEKAKSFLFLPDYFHYLLTGKMANEYTVASTSQLLDPNKRDWDYELLDIIGIKRDIFAPISQPGTNLGGLRKELVEQLGFDLDVILPCSHDTGSAVLAVPTSDDDYLYISSGTWSLLGIEKDEPDCSIHSQDHNFTNEGGYDRKIRYLHNIMGLWMIQSVRHNINDKYTFQEICEQAEVVKDFPSRVDVNNEAFYAPDNMIDAIKEYCQDTNQQVPETIGEIATVVYTSLADCYAKAIAGIEASTGRTYSRIHVVGGGSKDTYLNQLTADATTKTVYAGPSEATALGNLIAQMIENKEFDNKENARKAIRDSFAIKVFKPTEYQ